LGLGYAQVWFSLKPHPPKSLKKEPGTEGLEMWKIGSRTGLEVL